MPTATDATLTKLEKNGVLQVLTKHKFNPLDFAWRQTTVQEFTGRGYAQSFVSTLLHVQTGYYFMFGRYIVEWSPGRKNKVEREHHVSDWAIKFSLLNDWTRNLRDEVDAPDLWAMFANEQQLA